MEPIMLTVRSKRRSFRSLGKKRLKVFGSGVKTLSKNLNEKDLKRRNKLKIKRLILNSNRN